MNPCPLNIGIFALKRIEDFIRSPIGDVGSSGGEEEGSSLCRIFRM